jgi:hypothetical protein
MSSITLTAHNTLQESKDKQNTAQAEKVYTQKHIASSVSASVNNGPISLIRGGR